MESGHARVALVRAGDRASIPGTQMGLLLMSRKGRIGATDGARCVGPSDDRRRRRVVDRLCGVAFLRALRAGRCRSRSATARRSRDASTFPAVRQSLTEQIAATYLRLTGREARLGPIGRSVAIAAVTSHRRSDRRQAHLRRSPARAAAQRLAEPQSCPTRPAPLRASQGSIVPGRRSVSFGNLWQVFVQSEQGLRRFRHRRTDRVRRRARQLKLQFRLIHWVWKLSGDRTAGGASRAARPGADQADREEVAAYGRIGACPARAWEVDPTLAPLVSGGRDTLFIRQPLHAYIGGAGASRLWR